MVIVFSHFEFLKQYGAFGDAYWQFWHNATLGVDFFFVMSGFGMMLSSMRRDPSGAAPVGGIRGSLGFAQRHIRKIWPIYVIMLLVGVVYQLLYGTLELDFSPLRQIAKSAVLFPVCLTLLQSLTGSTSFSHALNGVCWFLSTIFCIYLISPFIMQFLKRHICKTHEALIGALVCIIASMLLGIVFESITARIAFFDDLDYGSPYRRVFYVILGMLLAQLYTWGRQHDGHGNVIERSGALEYLFIACSMVWFFTRQVVWSSAGPVTYLIDMTLVGGDTYALAVSKGAVSRLLSTRPLVYLGNISMFIFITHYLIRLYADFLVRMLGIGSLAVGIAEACFVLVVSLTLSGWLYRRGGQISAYDKLAAPFRRVRTKKQSHQ